jgi:hypothetical protein
MAWYRSLMEEYPDGRIVGEDRGEAGTAPKQNGVAHRRLR